mmetsp:Transcript_3915/g.11063  ORF Transcript_3915/g.11063 Transcript_3915/m.11063 type:complete len:304 (+) Transcript_3915:1827-2738(+)
MRWRRASSAPQAWCRPWARRARATPTTSPSTKWPTRTRCWSREALRADARARRLCSRPRPSRPPSTSWARRWSSWVWACRTCSRRGATPSLPRGWCSCRAASASCWPSASCGSSETRKPAPSSCARRRRRSRQRSVPRRRRSGASARRRSARSARRRRPCVSRRRPRRSSKSSTSRGRSHSSAPPHARRRLPRRKRRPPRVRGTAAATRHRPRARAQSASPSRVGPRRQWSRTWAGRRAPGPRMTSMRQRQRRRVWTMASTTLWRTCSSMPSTWAWTRPSTRVSSGSRTRPSQRPSPRAGSSA